MNDLDKRLIDLASQNMVSRQRQFDRELSAQRAQTTAQERKERRRNRALGFVQLGLGAGAAALAPFTGGMTAPLAGGLLGGGANALSGGRAPGLAGVGAMAGQMAGNALAPSAPDVAVPSGGRSGFTFENGLSPADMNRFNRMGLLP